MESRRESRIADEAGFASRPFRAAHCFLVVTSRGRISRDVISYALDVAERLGSEILVAYVNTMPLLWTGGVSKDKLRLATRENEKAFLRLCQQKNISLRSVQESGRIDRVIHRLCNIARNIDFVIIDKGIRMDHAMARSPVPVFNIFCGDYPSSRFVSTRRKGTSWRTTAKSSNSRIRSAILQAISLGLAIVFLYAFCIVHEEQIMAFCLQGGAYGLLPLSIVAVFYCLQAAFLEACRLSVRRIRRAAASAVRIPRSRGQVGARTSPGRSGSRTSEKTRARTLSRQSPS